MNTNDKGNIGLTKVLAELSEMGYNCFLPLTDTTCVDLIIANSKMELIRAQIKHRKIRNERIVVRCMSVINGKDVLIDKTKVDYFIIYCPDNKNFYYLPISVFENTKTVSLHIGIPKTKYKTMKFGDDYLGFKF